MVKISSIDDVSCNRVLCNQPSCICGETHLVDDDDDDSEQIDFTVACEDM